MCNIVYTVYIIHSLLKLPIKVTFIFESIRIRFQNSRLNSLSKLARLSDRLSFKCLSIFGVPLGKKRLHTFNAKIRVT